MISAVKHAASMPNPEFYERQRQRRSTWNIPRYLRDYDETLEGDLILPRGLLSLLEQLVDSSGSSLCALMIKGWKARPIASSARPACVRNSKMPRTTPLPPSTESWWPRPVPERLLWRVLRWHLVACQRSFWLIVKPWQATQFLAPRPLLNVPGTCNSTSTTKGGKALPSTGRAFQESRSRVSSRRAQRSTAWAVSGTVRP